MTASKQRESAIPVINEPAPQRPKTLLQRLSSGIIHVLPSFRTSTPKDEIITRPTTALHLISKRTMEGATFGESEQLLASQPEVTTTREPDQPCPYDLNTYYPFASVEKRRCSFCGMRGPKIVHNEPCHACRTGGPGSHICSDRKNVNTHRRHSAVDARHLAHLVDSSSSVLLAPRPVTPERAAKRIGNPPRVSRLPPGIIRLPAPNTLDAKQHQNAAVRPPSRLRTTSPAGTRHIGSANGSGSNSKAKPVKKPASPKLHHIHGLPNSESFPFVHKHEISKHAIALRAGSTSPLTDRNNNPRNSPNILEPLDYSNTVYYRDKNSPSPVGRVTAPKPQVTTVVVKQVPVSGRAVIDVQASPLDAALAGSEVYRKRSPQQTQPAKASQALVDITDSGTTFGSQDTGSTKIGGMRLELKGGSSPSNEIPRLRGGSGHDAPSTNTFSFKLKRWLLTCHGPCPDYLDTDSDADLPPPRVVTPERVARMRQRMNGTAPLPVHLSRTTQPTFPVRTVRPGPEDVPPSKTFVTTTSPPKRSIPSRMSNLNLSALFHRRYESPINQPASIPPSQVLSPPFPHLRGGAESPDKIPSTLFWLAGGRGKPISFSGWKQSRPKQRMGGLFGMAVFGDRYGQEYKVAASAVGDVGVECSASIKITMDDGVSVESLKGSADAASSSTSSTAEPVKETTAGVENCAPPGESESVPRAPTPAPDVPADDVPLCSGALPVEPVVGPPGDGSTGPVPRDDSEKKEEDVASGDQKQEGT